MSAERGSGTVLVVGVAGVAVAAAAGAMVLGGAVTARHRAEAAADLAALAGAQALQGSGQAAACPRARVVAAANGARASCAVAGEEVVVEAAVAVPALVAQVTGTHDAVARARAGPPRRVG